MLKDDLYNRIIEEYIKCNSVKQTAVNVGTSFVRAQRVLISEGLWHSKTSDAVCELYGQGMSSQEIADTLYISVKTVQAYLPYSKGFYSSNKSADALRSNLYRNRKMQAADKQVNRVKRDGDSNTGNTTDTNHSGAPSDKFRVMKLRLELIMDTNDRKLMNTLRKHAKVKNGIIREILVPSDISLHKLNYAIQKCFGWENSHLHKFSLPGKVFAELTGGTYEGEPDERYSHKNGSFVKWADYCGIYFRFPSEDWDDIYWDDDYEGDVSFKSWLKRKYNGNNVYLGMGEHFVITKKAARDFITENPMIRVVPSFEDYKAGKTNQERIEMKPISDATVRDISLIYGLDFDELIERLPINEVLRAKDDKKTTKKQLSKLVKDRNNLYENCLCRNIIPVIGNTSYVNKLPWSEDYVPVFPITDELIYRYDFGDGWGVKITCDEKYYFEDVDEGAIDSSVDNVWLDVIRVFNQNNERIFDDELEAIVNVAVLRQLHCVYADGLNVLDDVGGIYGFADFITDLHEGDPDERESLKTWASGQGWSGRETKPRNIL